MKAIILKIVYILYRVWFYVVFRLKSNIEFESPSLKNCNKKLKREILRAFWISAGLELEQDNYVSTDVKIICPKRLQMGIGSKVLSRCILDAREGISIGSDSYIGFGTVILTKTRAKSLDRNGKPIYSKSNANCTIIGDNCFIGANCMLLPGVEVKSNSVLGVSTLVLSNKTISGTVAGIPAKPIGNKSV